MKLKIVLVLLLILSIAGIAIIYKKTLAAYDGFNDLRLDPIGRTTYSKKFNFEDRFYEIVLLGDSHAENWIIDGKDVLNLGISSQTSHQIALRSDIIKNRLRGQTLILVIGANDILSTLTNKKQKEEIVQQCLENIRHIVSNHEMSFDRICVMTVPPFFRFPKKYLLMYDRSYHASMDALNAGIYSICKSRGNVLVLDAYHILSEKAKSERVTTDGLHMNQKGYQYITNLFDKKNTPSF